MWQNDAYDYLRLCTYYLMKDRFQKIKVSFEWMHIDAMNVNLIMKFASILNFKSITIYLHHGILISG